MNITEIANALIKNPDSIKAEQLPKGVYITELFYELSNHNSINLQIWHLILVKYYGCKLETDFIDLLNLVSQKEFEKQKYQSEKFSSEKINIINLYAIYYLIQYAKFNLDDTKNINIYINTSDKVKFDEPLTFALKGFLFFYQGELNKAGGYFQQSQLFNAQCIIPIIGMAILEYTNKNYQAALDQFKKAYKLKPKQTMYIKVGIAYCHLHLNKYDQAKACFKQILKKHPQNPQAILGLINLAFIQKKYEKYHKYIEELYKIYPSNPYLLLIIAEKYILYEQYEKASKIAQSGLNEISKIPKFKNIQNIKNDILEVKSRFHFILGYYNHFSQQYDEAFKQYSTAISFWPNNVCAQFGLGQICLCSRNFDGALPSFEKVLQNTNNFKFFELYKLLGYSYTKNGRKNEALKFYKQTISIDKGDFYSHIEYAQIQEGSDFQESLQAYQSALQIIEQNKESNKNPEYADIKPEILNNIGVLQTKLEMYSQAKSSFEQALALLGQAAKKNAQNLKYKAFISTVQFNLGYLFEELHQFGSAIQLYKIILNTNQYYIDAYLRQGYLAWKRGNYQRAQEYCEKSLQQIDMQKKQSFSSSQLIRPDLILALYAYIQEQKGSIESAKETLKKLQQQYNMKNDYYTTLFNLKMDYDESCYKRNSEPHKQKQAFKLIIRSSRQILEHDDSIVPAAQFIGIIHAEIGNFLEAKAIFDSLLETNAVENSSPFYFLVLENKGYLEFLQGKYQNAIEIFKSYQTKCPFINQQLDMQTVICYYQMKQYNKAIDLMKKLILKDPSNFSYRYNLNLITHTYCQHLIEQKKRTKEDSEKALKYLQAVTPIYKKLYDFDSYSARIKQCHSEDSKRRYNDISTKIRDYAETKYNQLTSNMDHYRSILEKDQQNEKVKLKQKEARQQTIKKILEEQENKKREEQLRKEEEKRMQEELALQCMEEGKEVANNIQDSLQRRLQKAQRKTKNADTADYEQMINEEPNNFDEYDYMQEVPNNDEDQFSENEYNPKNVPAEFALNEEALKKSKKLAKLSKKAHQGDRKAKKTKDKKLEALSRLKNDYDDVELEYLMDQEEQPKKSKKKKKLKKMRRTSDDVFDEDQVFKDNEDAQSIPNNDDFNEMDNGQDEQQNEEGNVEAVPMDQEGDDEEEYYDPLE